MDMDLVDFVILWPLPLELDDQHLQNNELGGAATQLNTIDSIDTVWFPPTTFSIGLPEDATR